MHEITFIIRSWNDLEGVASYPREAGWRFRLIDVDSDQETVFDNPEDLMAHIKNHLHTYSPDNSNKPLRNHDQQ